MKSICCDWLWSVYYMVAIRFLIDKNYRHSIFNNHWLALHQKSRSKMEFSILNSFTHNFLALNFRLPLVLMIIRNGFDWFPFDIFNFPPSIVDRPKWVWQKSVGGIDCIWEAFSHIGAGFFHMGESFFQRLKLKFKAMLSLHTSYCPTLNKSWWRLMVSMQWWPCVVRNQESESRNCFSSATIEFQWLFQTFTNTLCMFGALQWWCLGWYLWGFQSCG